MAGKKKQAQLTPEEKLQQALVPEAEQPYKVPANWCWVKAPFIFNIEYGKGLSSKELLEKGYPVFGANGQIGYYNEYMFENAKALMSCRGAYSGTMNLSLPKSFVTSNSLIIDSKGAGMSEHFTYFLFSALNKKSIISGSAQPQITVQAFAKYPIPLPPLVEQQRIVERIESLFAKLDEGKENLQNVLDGFETRKAAILHKAFTGELTANWRKQHGVSMDSWEEKRLGKVCKINPSKINTKNLSDDLEVSFFPMVSLSEITGEIVGPEIRTLGKVKNGFTNFSEGDVVFAKITPCMENGKSAIIGKLINDIGYGTTEFYVLRCGEELSNKYLHHIVRSKKFRDEAKQNMTGAVGQQRVPKKYMEDYMLNLPTFYEQTEIVRIIDDLLAKEQQAKELAENALAKIDLIKKSILARAFRSELGTNNLADEPAVELLKQML